MDIIGAYLSSRLHVLQPGDGLAPVMLQAGEVKFVVRNIRWLSLQRRPKRLERRTDLEFILLTQGRHVSPCLPRLHLHRTARQQALFHLF